MATFFISHAVFSNHPARNNYICSSQTPPPPPLPPSSSPPPPVPPSQNQSPSLIASSAEQPAPVSTPLQSQKQPAKPSSSPSTVESTDWIASSLTRRFGLGAGLAWFGFLAAGVISEQVKTRFEVFEQESNTRNVEEEQEVVLPNGIRYYELRVGGGASPRTGDLIVIDLKGKVEGSEQAFVDTFGKEKKPLALVMGSRPYSKGMCEGLENAMKSMKAGGKRKVIVPAALGFGEEGADLGSGVQIPPFSTLEYIVEIDKVSIAPA